MSLSFLLTSFLWTGLLALIAEGLTRRQVTPYFAQSIWRFTALFMVVPWAGLIFGPLFPAPDIPLPEFPDLILFSLADDTPAILKAASHEETVKSINPSHLLLGVLILGWGVQCLANLRGHIRLYALKRTAKHHNTPIITQLSAKWASHLRLPLHPQIAYLATNRSPFVSGLFRPVIYMPKGLTDKDHLAYIIAHECTHIARGDLIARPLERMIAFLLWFSPFAWMARAKLDYYREAVCDIQTIKLTGDAVAYSRALAHVARNTRPMPTLPMSALIPNTRRNLPMRISSVLEPQKKTSGKQLSFSALALLMITPLALAQSVESPGSKTQSFSAAVVKVDGSKVTSPYGLRTDPFTQKSAWHAGVDIGAGKTPPSTPISIYTPAAGKVVFSGNKPGYDNLIIMQLSSSGHHIRFGHLASLSVEAGDTIEAGTQIGTMGRSARAIGRHLHFEYLIDGKAYDPTEIEGLKLTASDEGQGQP